MDARHVLYARLRWIQATDMIRKVRHRGVNPTLQRCQSFVQVMRPQSTMANGPGDNIRSFEPVQK
jgi:hypothetical protein